MTFNCPNGNITLDGSLYCTNQTNVQYDLGTGQLSFTMNVVPNGGYEFSSWSTTGDACLGSMSSCINTSTVAPVTLWDYCGPGAKCTGSVTVHLIAGSPNWAGYAVTGNAGSVTAVNGSWVVPSIQCSTDHVGEAAFWVGIDGYNPYVSQTVEQAGVTGSCKRVNPGYIEVYQAWYEFYPASEVVITSISVASGDTVTVNVTYNSNSSMFTVAITDGSQHFSHSASLSSAVRDSAECIVERPQTQSGLEPLAKFGTVDFGKDYTSTVGCGADLSGLSGAFGGFHTVSQIDMVDGSGTALATPSALSSDGTSFTVTWQAAT